MRGYVQVYTGDGKGKTTASLGLSLRAAGAGLRVYIAQFIKSGDYSEIKALRRFEDLITVEQFGLGRFIKGRPADADIQAGKAGIEKIKQVFAEGQHDVVIVEEGNTAAACGVFPVETLLELIRNRPESVELVITGRGADPEVMARADLVTEMQAVKHYYEQGVAARVGIEK
ncbi:MAG: cob(I)yrinic acid a,c-diamide adenosyltransferase [Desulfobacterales bacterium]|nr:cob(I)yrinic acid a,c-diamide adenosyltransferase [Desulfobacterales bacterium]